MDQQEDTFLSHLFELRDRLIKALLSIGIVFVCLFPWAKELYALLAQPLIATLPQGGQMIATDVVGVFLVPMKVALMVAFLIVLPYVLYQVWAFVAPGLYSHEKRLALPLVAASVVLFFVGMSFAYFLVFPTVFKFMANIAPEGVAWMTDIEKYLSFVMSTFLAFGVTFEVPVVVVVLVRMNIVALETLKEWRSYMIVAAFVIAAIFTPPDVISQLMLAIPLCLLYELGMLMAKFVSKPVKPESDGTDLVWFPSLVALFTLARQRRAFADPDRRRELGFLAQQSERHAGAGFERGDQVEHDLWVLDRLSFNRKQNVARADSARVGRTAALDAGDQGAAGVLELERLGQFRRDLLRFDADPAACYGTGLDDLLHDAAGGRDGDSEADAERAARA